MANPSFFFRMISRSNARPIAAPHAADLLQSLASTPPSPQSPRTSATGRERTTRGMMAISPLGGWRSARSSASRLHRPTARNDRSKRIPGLRHEARDRKIERNSDADDAFAGAPLTECVASLCDVAVHEKQSRVVEELPCEVEIQPQQRIPVDRSSASRLTMSNVRGPRLRLANSES